MNEMNTSTRFGALALTACLTAGATHPASADSVLKDLDIRQVDMAKIAPEAQAPASSVGELNVKASVDRSDRTYRHGDKLVLTVETTEDAYVWVYDTGTSGKVHQIFPNQHHATNFVRAGAPVRIPDEDASYQLAVNHPVGQELITVIASKNDTPIDVETMGAAGPFIALRGTASSVAKDISISLKKNHPAWVSDQQVLYIR